MKTGNNVSISPLAVIYNGEHLVIGDNVRIDDFVVLSCGGGLVIGSYVHIACYTALYAGNGMDIGDFTGISAHCALYSASDDYSGEALSNPTVPDPFKRVTRGKVLVGRHCLVGHGSTVMPGVHIGDGVSIGAHSFVNRNCVSWGIYAGVPAVRIKERSNNALNLERILLNG